MSTVRTCSICNKPLVINDQRLESYATVAIETMGRSEMLRGKSTYKLSMCNDCIEKILLAPSDEAETKLKEKLGECE